MPRRFPYIFIIKIVAMKQELDVSILSERRAFQPYGLNGGGNGARGLNLLRRAHDGRIVSLGGKNTVRVQRGDTLTICTPGGGGYGRVDDSSSQLGEAVLSRQSERPQLAGGSLLQYANNQETA